MTHSLRVFDQLNILEDHHHHLHRTTKNEIMKSDLDLVNECDSLSYDPTEHHQYYSFEIEGYKETFGYLLESTVNTFTWPTGWTIDRKEKTVLLSGSTLEQRNCTMNSTITAEAARGTFRSLRKLSGELFAVYGPKKELVMTMDRSATVLFGVVTYAVQLLAYDEIEGSIKLWIARRSKSKSNFPGLLDVTVGGGLPAGETPLECVIREAEEEAAVAPSLTLKLITSCGTTSYTNISDERMGGEIGLIRPKVVYIFEMKLVTDIKPQADSDEVEAMTLMDVEELKNALATGQFAPTQSCAVLDFLIRHGIVTAENESNLIEISSRLHRRHVFPTV